MKRYGKLTQSTADGVGVLIKGMLVEIMNEGQTDGTYFYTCYIVDKKRTAYLWRPLVRELDNLETLVELSRIRGMKEVAEEKS